MKTDMAQSAMILVLMGVSGAGKTTIGTLLSQRTGWVFLDGDDFHPAANRAKMAAGIPLTDEDRAPWLDAIRKRMQQLVSEGSSAIVACSALKQQYRDHLSDGFAAGQVQFALLTAPAEVIAQRLHQRSHEFMNPDLLPSQLATLEPPSEAWQIPVIGTPEQAADLIQLYLRQAASSRTLDRKPQSEEEA